MKNETNPLPILEIISKSITYPWYLRKRLAPVLLPMFFALVSLELTSTFIYRAGYRAPSYIFILIAVPLTVLYTITIHRVLLLGFDATPKSGAFEWRRREWRFLFYALRLTVLLGSLFALPLIMFFSNLDYPDDDIFDPVILRVIYLLIALAFVRLSLVFPAIAVDSNLSIQESWKASEGNTIRLCIVLYSIPLAGIALFDVLPVWTYQNFDLLVTVAGVLFEYVLWVIQIACLSFAYQYLVARPEEN